ncbi:hypothetical protein EGW08_013338, partial [Elysia chlorotica]
MAAPFIQTLCPRLFSLSVRNSSIRSKIQSIRPQNCPRHFSFKILTPSLKPSIKRIAATGSTAVVLATTVHYYLQSHKVIAEDSLFEDQERPTFKPSREKIVTMDETWIYQFDPEPKNASMQWKRPSSPPP